MIECVPGESVEVVKPAWAEPFNPAVPSVVEPSLNSTAPVGVPEAEDVTVAVNVTGEPAAEGLADEASAVAVAACPLEGLQVWLLLTVKLPTRASAAGISSRIAVATPAAVAATAPLKPVSAWPGAVSPTLEGLTMIVMVPAGVYPLPLSAARIAPAKRPSTAPELLAPAT